MPPKKVDLFLGGSIGLWALRRVSPRQVSRIFTPDEEIIKAADALGIEAGDRDVNADDLGRRGIGFSVHYPRILRPHVIGRYEKIYNLHPGYLPWGRGFYPVFWALWEQTPAGATLHEVTAGVDEGPVVAQTRVQYYPYDTGGSLHERVRAAEEELFLDYWPRIVEGREIVARAQAEGAGSRHTKREFFALKERAPVECMSGPDLLRLIRCLSFPGFTGLEVSIGEKKFEVRLEQLAGRAEG